MPTSLAERVRTQFGTRAANAAAGEASPGSTPAMAAVSKQTEPVPPWQWDPSSKAPPEADPEAIRILAQARGLPSVNEAEGAVAQIDREMSARVKGITNLESGRKLAPSLQDLLARRFIYAARAASLRVALGMPARPLPNPPTLPSLVYFEPGQPAHPDVAGFLAKSIAAAKREADEAQAGLEAWTAVASDDRYPQQRRYLHDQRGVAVHPQDATMERLVIFAKQRRQALARVAALTADVQAAADLVGVKVRQAVDAAGGRAAVIEGVVAAGAITNPGPSSNVRALEAQQAEALAGVTRLEAAGLTEGLAVQAARAKHEDVARQLGEARKASVDQRHAMAAVTVDRACEGAESSRAQLEHLAAVAPVAFSPGFASAVAASRWDIAVFAELNATLQAAN